MICPKCNEQMSHGKIESLDTLSWTPEYETRPRNSRWSLSDNAVLLDRCGLVRRARVTAYHCPTCKMIIVPVE